MSNDFPFSLQIVKDRLAASGSCFAFCHLIVENSSREYVVLVLKWLNTAMLQFENETNVIKVLKSHFLSFN